VLAVSEPSKVRGDKGMTKSARKAEFNQQLLLATEYAQAIKLADILDNTQDMTNHATHNSPRAERFLMAKRTTLALLTRGNIILQQLCDKALDGLEEALLQ